MLRYAIVASGGRTFNGLGAEAPLNKLRQNNYILVSLGVLFFS